MGDKASSSLTYGHFGQAVYNISDKTWEFDRSHTLEHHVTIEPVGESEVVIPASAVELGSSQCVQGNEGTIQRHKDKAKALIRSNPELQPASEIIAEFARVSEAVEAATSRHDSAKGTLLAFGTIADNRQKTAVTVAAFPVGPTGGDLRVVVVRNQQQGWDDSRDAWLEVPKIDGEDVVWKGPGVPIQSIVFSLPGNQPQVSFHDLREYGDCYLAVRLITSLMIFRPRLKRHHVSGLRTLVLDFILELGIEETGETGGAVHADIRFNPYRCGNFIVVNQAGSFSSCEMEGRVLDGSERIFLGNLSDNEDLPQGSLDDGWGRVIWIGDATTIAVCNRRTLKIYDTTNDTPVELQNVDVGLGSGIGWILDIAPLPIELPSFLVLTSTRILLQRLRTKDGQQPVLENFMSILHFRNAEDISLRLHVLVDEDDIVILVRSGINTTVISYRLQMSGDSSIVASDAMEFTLPHNTNKLTWSSTLVDMHFLPTPIRRGQKLLVNDSLARRCMQDDVRFYSLTSLHKNYCVQQALYYVSEGGIDIGIRPASWEKNSSKKKLKTEDDDFIVNDDEMDAESIEHEPQSSFIRRRQHQSNSRLGDEWTVNYELTMQELNETEDVEEANMEEILEEARILLQQTEVDRTAPIRTLRELTDAEVDVRGIEDSEVSLRALRLLEPDTLTTNVMGKIETQGEGEQDESENQQGQLARLLMHSIPMPPATGFSSSQNVNMLSSTHESIVQNWMSPLPKDIVGLVRSRNQRLARSIAAEVTLASQVLRLEKPELPQLSLSQSRSRSQTPLGWDLPLRTYDQPAASRATPSTSYHDASSQVPSSAGLPTPSRSGTPSGTTRSSPSATSTAAEFSRLSRYATFSKSAPQPLPRALNRVLSHWVPGSDPASYDWLSSSRQLSRWEEEQGPDDSQLTERERKRLQRHTERYIKRQRREAEESQRQQMLSSQVPEIVSASQPRKVESQPARSSQMFGASQGPASQVLPGRHGGRPAKKKRKSGF